MDLVRALLQAIAATKNGDLMTAFNKGLLTLLTRPVVVMELSDLRQFLIIMEHPLFTDASAENPILTRTAALMSSLASDYKNTLIGWLAACVQYPLPARRILIVFVCCFVCVDTRWSPSAV